MTCLNYTLIIHLFYSIMLFIIIILWLLDSIINWLQIDLFRLPMSRMAYSELSQGISSNFQSGRSTSIILLSSSRLHPSSGSGNPNASQESSLTRGFYLRIVSIQEIFCVEEINFWKKGITMLCAMMILERHRSTFSLNVLLV